MAYLYICLKWVDYMRFLACIKAHLREKSDKNSTLKP